MGIVIVITPFVLHREPTLASSNAWCSIQMELIPNFDFLPFTVAGISLICLGVAILLNECTNKQEPKKKAVCKCCGREL